MIFYFLVTRAVLSKVKDRSSIILPGWKWDELSNVDTTEQSAVDSELSQVSIIF